MTIINPNSISGISSITALNSTAAINLFKDDGTAANIITGITTGTNFKTGSSNLHSVGIEIAGINVLGADTPIGAGATIYNSGAAVFTGIVTATNINIDRGSASDTALEIDTTSTSNACRIKFNESGSNKAQIAYSHDNDRLELVASSGNSIVFYSGGNLTTNINTDGHLYPHTDSTYDLGLTGTRWRNVYADTLYGSGANLTSLPAQATIANNADNRVITGGSGVNLNGEANLTFDGSLLTVSGNLILHSGGATRTLQMGPSSAGIEYNVNGTTFIQGRTDAYPLAFKTQSVERLRITSEGYLKYSGTSVADETNKLGRLLMPSHDTNEEDVLYIQMQQEGTFNKLEFGGGSGSYNAATQISFRTATAVDTVTGVERLRIFSNGSVGVGDYSSTNLTHAFQALRTSGSTYVSSKNTGGNALFYAEASNGNTAKLELMQAGTGYFSLEVGGGSNALMFKDDGTERLRIESGGTLFSKSPSDATPNFKFISDDTNWHGYLNQTVHGSTISSILSCGGTWTVDGVTYAATKDYNGSFGTAALIVHNQYNGTATGGELVFVTKANGSSTTDGAVTERFRIKSDGTVNCLGTAALTVPVGTTAQRPSSLATGMMRYNSTTTQLELYGGNGWFNVMDGIGQVGTASNPAESGKQLKDLGRSSGNYYIRPKGYSGSAIEAYVDMTTNGGGWVLVAAFPLQHSGLTMSGNTGGLNESSVKNYATTVPSNSSAAFYNKNFINYLFHQNATNDSNSTYSIAGVHGRSGNGYILWEIKAQSTHTNSSTDAFTTIYKTSDANNNFDVRYYTNSSNTLNNYVGTSSGGFNSYANYNDGRGGTSDGGNNYHYLIDDITGGYEWAFRENSDDNPGNNNPYNLSNIFIR